MGTPAHRPPARVASCPGTHLSAAQTSRRISVCSGMAAGMGRLPAQAPALLPGHRPRRAGSAQPAPPAPRRRKSR